MKAKAWSVVCLAPNGLEAWSGTWEAPTVAQAVAMAVLPPSKRAEWINAQPSPYARQLRVPHPCSKGFVIHAEVIRA